MGEVADTNHKLSQCKPLLVQSHQDMKGLAPGRNSDSRVFVLLVVLRVTHQQGRQRPAAQTAVAVHGSVSGVCHLVGHVIASCSGLGLEGANNSCSS